MKKLALVSLLMVLLTACNNNPVEIVKSKFVNAPMVYDAPSDTWVEGDAQYIIVLKEKSEDGFNGIAIGVAGSDMHEIGNASADRRDVLVTIDVFNKYSVGDIWAEDL